jgi:hypothetical protein
MGKELIRRVGVRMSSFVIKDCFLTPMAIIEFRKIKLRIVRNQIGLTVLNVKMDSLIIIISVFIQFLIAKNKNMIIV